MISDTHGFHKDLIVPKADMVIHAGDFSNTKDPGINANEVRTFLEWYREIPIPIKALCAGNHDTSIEKGLITVKDLSEGGIIYMQHAYREIDGIKIFASPFTPEFCDWAFNVRRDRLFQYWKDIPKGLDILVTHGPPKGILDIADKLSGEMEYCGDKALLNKVMEANPKVHQYGHIHNNGIHMNQGTREYQGITFVNSSCVTDRKFSLGCTSQGVIINI